MDLVRRHGLGEGREEVLDASCGRLAVVRKSQQVRLRVGEGQPDAAQMRHAVLFVNVGLGSLDGEATVGDVPFLVGQALPGIGKVRENKDQDDSKLKRESQYDIIWIGVFTMLCLVSELTHIVMDPSMM